MNMKCSIAKRKLPAYLADVVSADERQALSLHLRTCSSCSDESERHRQLGKVLRSLPQREVPPELTLRLRMVASHSRAQQASRVRAWWNRTTFAFSNMMRPFGVPIAGGLCSTVLLFCTLLPAFTMPQRSADVPAVVFTQPLLESMAPIPIASADAIVDLRIDAQGRIVNWSISEPSGHTEAVHRSIENSLLFTRFAPATLAPNSCTDCAVPTASTIRLVFRSNYIEVRG